MNKKKFMIDVFRGRFKPRQISNSLRYALGERSPNVKWDPVYLSIFPTYRCNLSCDMCLTHSTKKKNRHGQKPGNDMTFDVFKDIVDRYDRATAVNLIGNGEPLLNEELFSMIEYAATCKCMYTYSSSNGLKLGDFVEDFVTSSLTQLTISLNGYDENGFHRMTGMNPSDFRTICDNVRRLVEVKYEKRSGLIIQASFIIDRLNYSKIPQMVELGRSLGVDNVQFFQFLPSEDVGYQADERCLFSDDVEVKERMNGIRTNQWYSPKYSLPKLLNPNCDHYYCQVPFYNMSVDGEGNVGGCSCQLLDFIDNGKYYDEDAWNNYHFQGLRRRFLQEIVPASNNPCKYCYNNCPEVIYSRFGISSELISGIMNRFLK